MTRIFCPRCGNDADVLYGSVCRQCFIGDKKLLEGQAVVHMRICPTCGSVYRRGKWLSRGEESETVIESVKESLKINREARDIELMITPKRLDYSRYRVHVEAKANIEGIPIDVALDTEVRISWETCDTCSRISGGYFEGIVQVRAGKRLPTPEELEKCRAIAGEAAARTQEKGERLAFIAKIAELDEGIDIYVGSSKLGKQICRAITENLGGKFSESPKLVGQKDGEDLYRITYAVRLPEFVRGDIINVDDKVVEVVSSGKHVSGIDLETGRRFIENFNDLLEIKKLGRRQDAVPAVLVAYEDRTILVLDPETYETVAVKRPEFLSAKPGDEIKVVKTVKGIYVVP